VVEHLYPNFLADDRAYSSTEAAWADLWTRVVRRAGQAALWRAPWLNTHFANGTPFRDGDPIFSAVDDGRQMGVRVIQLEPETPDDEHLEWRVDSVGEWSAPDSVRTLVVSCVLSVATRASVHGLFYDWVVRGEVPDRVSLALPAPDPGTPALAGMPLQLSAAS
jgi:hypothetical protein